MTKSKEALQAEWAERNRLRDEAVALFAAMPEVQQDAIIDDIKEDLKQDGWHHEDDCDYECEHGSYDDVDEELTSTALALRVHAELTAWHDKVHGLSLLSACTSEPCRSVSQQLLMVTGVPA